MTASALVLAGGGLAGIAWELGILLGIRDENPDLYASITADATTFVGTSAGSAVAAQIASGADLDQLFDAQVEGVGTELGAEIDLLELQDLFAAAMVGVTTPEEGRRRLGSLALAATTSSEADRRAAIVGHLPNQKWPARRMLITAIDTETGNLRVFDRDSGVDLIDVVGASCAVPGVWPPVTIDGRRYMDGGVRSGANADLAAGADRVLIITPSSQDAPPEAAAVPRQHLRALEPGRSLVIYADAASIASFGSNPLDPATTGPAALAGREQGRASAARVADFWN
ncbi:MAG: hypothetical protein JWQ12_1688 [Glaciihabitans sp.]|nr:hypothetical protein [Glaciihabitans sp.]